VFVLYGCEKICLILREK